MKSLRIFESSLMIVMMGVPWTKKKNLMKSCSLLLVVSIVAADMLSMPVRRYKGFNHIQAAIQRAKNREPIRNAIETHDYSLLEGEHFLSTVPLPLSPYDHRKASLIRHSNIKTAQFPRDKNERELNPNSRISSKSRHERKLEVAETSFISCSDIIYYGEISLGTPTQTMQVILDTGSADLWLFSSTCSNCPSGTNKYTHSASSTYVANGDAFTIEYADGDTVSGTLSVDKLTWGGLVAPSQGFAEISDADSFSIVCVEDGLLGMGFDSLASSQQTTPFHSLMNAGQVSSNIFAFYLYDDDTGVLTLGGTNAQHHASTIQWISLATPQYGFWEIPLKYAQAKGGTKVAKSNTAIMDTGTTLIVGPSDDCIQLAKEVGALCYFYQYISQTLALRDCDSGGSYYMALVPCGAGLESKGGSVPDPPVVSFAFGTTATTAHTFELGADDYSLAPTPCPAGYFMDCAGSCIASSSNVVDWIGDGYCDSGQYGYFFNCPAWECDGGDCSSEECSMGDPGEVCFFGIEGGLSDSDSYWIFGDVFLRTVYTAYNYGSKKVGLAYSQVGDSDAPTRAPVYAPTPDPTRAPVNAPTATPTERPTPKPVVETEHPSERPTAFPSQQPSSFPIPVPSVQPHPGPTLQSMAPSTNPTPRPTSRPTYQPSPSPFPSPFPTSAANKWSQLEVTVSFQSDDIPTSDQLALIVNALFDVSDAMGDIINVRAYEIKSWTQTSNSRKLSSLSLTRQFLNKKSMPQKEQMKVKHSVSNAPNLRSSSQTLEDSTELSPRRLSGIVSILVQTACDADIRSKFGDSEAWSAQVSSELLSSKASGALDLAVQQRCLDCSMTADALSVDLSDKTMAPTSSPTKYKRRPITDDDDDGKRNRSDDTDDGGGASPTSNAVAAVIVIAVLVMLILGAMGYAAFCHGENSVFLRWLESERSKFNSLPDETSEEVDKPPLKDTTSKNKNDTSILEVELSESIPSSMERKAISNSIKLAQMEALGWEADDDDDDDVPRKSTKGPISIHRDDENVQSNKSTAVADAIYAAQLSGWKKKKLPEVDSVETNPIRSNVDEDGGYEDQSNEKAMLDDQNDRISAKPKKSMIRSMLSPYQAVGGGKGGMAHDDNNDDDDDEGEYDVPLSFKQRIADI